MKSGFISTRHKVVGPGKLGFKGYAKANVKGSRLNKGGDMAWRGKRS